MAASTTTDQILWQGDDTPPLTWGFGPAGQPEIPAGAEFRLDVAWLGGPAHTPIDGALQAASPTGGLVVDYVAGTVAWSYTAAQSAQIPRNALVAYQLRCLYQGKTQTWACGRIFVRGIGRDAAQAR